jgi:hypothetical protein
MSVAPPTVAVKGASGCDLQRSSNPYAA